MARAHGFQGRVGSLAIVLALLATACGGARVAPAITHEIQVTNARSVADLHRVLAREAWVGATEGCTLFWGESPRIYWDVQPVVFRWGSGEELHGFVLCGQAREAALRDPRIGQRIDAIFMRGTLALVSPAGTLPYRAHPMSDEGDGETSVLLRFDPDRSEGFWNASELLEELREVEDDALIGAWEIEPPVAVASR